MELPDPGPRYFEIETAIKHGGWWSWCQLTRWERDELMAHELHKGMRQRYEMEMDEQQSRNGGSSGVEAPWDAVRRRFFGGTPE